jgi:hypothetical protein
MIRSLLLALVIAGCAAPARQQTAADAFAPLMGCWRGTFDGQPNIHDERCFETLGEHVVDTHHVRPTTYAGETTYHLDDAQREIVFAYASNDGGRSNGSMHTEGERLIFPAHAHRSSDGAELRLRSTWTIESPDRFVTVSEQKEAGAWRPFMRITYTRAPELQPPMD